MGGWGGFGHVRSRWNSELERNRIGETLPLEFDLAQDYSAELLLQYIIRRGRIIVKS